MQVKFKKLHPDAVIPKYAKEGDCGLDLTAISYKYENGRHIYDTGLAVEVPEYYVGLIYPRSSICKYDLRLSNCVGVLDQNFRGSIKFFFENDSMEYNGGPKNLLDENGEVWAIAQKSKRIYQPGDRIGQLIIQPCPKIEPTEVTELSETVRGSQGFGSSGT